MGSGGLSDLHVVLEVGMEDVLDDGGILGVDVAVEGRHEGP